MERNHVTVTLCRLCIPTKRRSYREHRLCDVTSPSVYAIVTRITVHVVAHVLTNYFCVQVERALRAGPTGPFLGHIL